MSSRNRKDVVTLFDVFCVVGQTDGGGIAILKKYPEDFNDVTSLRNVVLFSFPCGSTNDEEAVQLFTFVLTNEKSQYTYGYCRYTPVSNRCLCILSGLPWTSLFYALLNHLSAFAGISEADVLESLLTHAYHVPIPDPGGILTIESSFKRNKLEVVVPDSSRLPTLRDNKQLLELYSAMNVEQLIALYASLLHERRIIFTGYKLGQLTSCTSAAVMLLYPMHWQNCYAPLLPEHMKSYLQAPIPFLFGVPRKIYQAMKDDNLSKAVVIDLHKRTFISPYDDVHALPSEVVNGLRHQLSSSADMFLSDRFARSFLRANVYLFGNYRAGLKFSPVCSWDKEQFIQHQRSNLKIFLESLLGKEGVQYLERFLEERVEAINAGEIIYDEFEKEIMIMDKSLFKSSSLNNVEILHHAVSSVRGNANDVIGALKDKVQFIALRGRFSGFSFKHNGRKDSSKKRSSFFDDVPMSFDTQQWNTGISGNGESPPQSVPPNEGVDLIDLSDEVSTMSTPASNSYVAPRSLPISPQLHMSRRVTSDRSLDQYNSTFELNSINRFSSPNDVTFESGNPEVKVFRQNWQRFD